MDTTRRRIALHPPRDEACRVLEELGYQVTPMEQAQAILIDDTALPEGVPAGMPIVFLGRSPPLGQVTPSPIVERVLADAYVRCGHTVSIDQAYRQPELVAALGWVLAEDRGARATGAPRLVWLGGYAQGFEPGSVSLLERDGRTEVGRSLAFVDSVGANVYLATGTVARIHARIERDGDGFTLVDVGSTNGTFLFRAGQPSTRLAPNEPTQLQFGDHVEFADFAAHFRLDGSLTPG